jgi:superoxide dismutase, Cu-Zn family
VPRFPKVALYAVLGFVAALGYSKGASHRLVLAESPEPGAYADVVSPVEEKLGTAKFFPVADGVKIELDVIQQVPGLHAVQILSVGKCEGPDFTSAGQPFDPREREHESVDSDGVLAGDLPNVEAGLDGHLQATVIAKGVTLGEGPDSLFHPGGTAIVIDENPHDYTNGRGGISNPRVACGVIERDGGATAP